MQPTPQDNQLMSKHRVLSFKAQLRLEWRGQYGQDEIEQPDHSASLGDSITLSTRTRFSVHTGLFRPVQKGLRLLPYPFEEGRCEVLSFPREALLVRLEVRNALSDLVTF
jgi:hypothetical protein